MSLKEKIIAYQEKNSPAYDKLKHYYWSNKWWSFFGAILALIVLLVVELFFNVNWWCLPVVVFPYLVAKYVGEAKEKRDATGLGNVEKEDIKYTVKPSYIQVFFLLIILISTIYK